VSRNLCQLLCQLDGFVEAAILVNQAAFSALISGPNASLANRINVSLVLASTFRDFGGEVLVSILQELFELGPLSVAEFFRFAEHAGVLPAHDISIGHANPIVEPFHHRLTADNSDGPRNR